MACNPFEIIRDPAGCAGQVVEAAVGDAIENMASAVMEAFGKAIGSLGTVWVHIGTPNLTGSGGGSAIDAGSTPPEVSGLTTVLGYVTWISLAVAIVSLFVLGGMIATRMRAGEGVAAVGRVGLVLAAVVLISGASAIVTGLLPDGPNNATGAVLFLQSSLWYFMGAAAILSVIIGGARMAWENRAEPGRELVRSLLTLVVVAGAGVTIVGLLVTAADSFSVWVLNGALSCDVASDSACFGENMLTLLALSSNPAAGGLGALLIIILGLIAILAAAFQIVLMVARGGMLVILAGILPLSASFTNTEMGKGWFKKCIAWLVAFILYKPAAAIVYAAAFQLVGTDVFSDDGTGFLAVLTGLMLMLIALFALPALMRFVTPMVGAMAGGAGGALAMGALAALPSGAAALGRLASGSGSGGDSGSSGSNGGSGATGNDGQGSPGPSGDSGPSGNKAGGGGASQEAQSSGPQQAGGTSTGAGAGSPAPSTGTAAASAGGGGGTAAAGAGGGAAAGGAAAGGGAAAAGAAAGPIGVAAGAALEAGKKAGQAAAGAAQSVGQQATGDEGGGPDGSR